VIGDTLSRQAVWKLRVWGTLSILAIFTLGVVQANRWAPYPWAFTIMDAAWFIGLVLWDSQEYEKKMKLRSMGKVPSFAMPPFGVPFGIPPGRRVSLSGGGDLSGAITLRPDPHPAGAQVKFDTVVRIRLVKSIRLTRYERVSDPTKWVV
jgi:hypothetical protein